MRIPEDVPFEILVTDTINLFKIETTTDESHNFVNEKNSVESAFTYVKTYAKEKTTAFTRVPPSVMSRLARGGKTTFLSLLFDKLKSAENNEFNPLFITFNFTFLKYEGESHLNAILRLIACQLISEETLSKIKDKRLIINKSALLNYIERTSNGKAVVLLIDELNSLGFPLESEASMFLKQYFLDPKDRYLVYTTHIPFDIEKDTLGDYNNSHRDYLVVDPPTCFDIEKLQNMSKYCSSLTNTEMLIY